MKKLTTSIIILFALTLSAQSIKVRGTIKDSIGEPLELANVIATVKESGAIESYGITNYEGRFQLDLPVNNTYILRASFLGYETSEMEITVPENASDLKQNFTLNSKAAELDGVEIVYEMPVTVRGDTIIYNADSFTNGTERKLGDVMKKLPGVEINEDGEIEVEGKTVTKVMVEGKDFFDGDSKLATKNIPADAVDKIEVLRNYNEVDQMRGLGNDQDNVAINIKLKDGKKNFWFGEVTAGGGVADDEGRYLVHPKLFYYSPKYSLNFITDFNNIGEVPFTFRDYFKFTGGFRNFNRGGGTNFSVSQSDLGFALMQNNKAKEIEAKFFAGNFSWEASEALDISGFAILSDNKTDIVTNSIRNFVTSNATETTNNISDQRTQLGMLKLSAVYKPNVNFQLDYDALYKTSKQTENNQTLSLVDNIENNIDEEKENKPSSINQNVNLYYTLNDDHIFAGQVQHLYQDEDPFYNAVLDLLPFSGIIPVDQDQDRFNINQEKNIQTNKLDAKVDYYYVINNKSNINFILGTTLSRQNFNSNMFQLLDNNDQIDFDDALPDPNGDIYSLINDVTYNFSDLFLGVHYKFKTGKFTFTPGVTLHNYILKNEQSGTSITQNDWNVLPDLNIILQLKKSESLRFNYSISQDYTDVNNYAEAYVFSDYNRMFRGNRNLENSLSHNYNLTYFSFNMFNYTNFNGSINYSRRIESVKYNSLLVGINQVSTPINMDSNFPDETFSGFGQFSKRIKKIQFNASARVSYSTTFNNINANITESTSFTQNYKASVRSNFRDWPNFEVGYSAIINDYENGGSPQTFYTHSPFANVDVKFLKHFTFTADWNFYNYSDKANTVENQYSFLDANLYFQKGDSPWEFKIQATNILDTEFTNSDSFNDEFNTTTQYFVLPRIVMFVVKYDL
ncbi:MAG: carboxypeptidase-like regulatory domain-containing protein [Flavobacteriaceae bacterium]